MNDNENKQILEINPNDSSIDTRQIPIGRSAIRRTLAGLLLGFTLFSGSALGPQQVNAADLETSIVKTDTVSDDTIIDIPSDYQYEVAYICGKEKGENITVGDLKNASNVLLSFSIYDDQSLDWMNYLRNVENIVIVLHDKNTKAFQDIEKLSGTKSLTITTLEQAELTQEDFKFLANSPDIQDLNLYGLNIEPGILEGLSNLKTLSLANAEGLGFDYVDLQKLTFLDGLDFPLNGVYDLAMILSNSTYKQLTDSGVKITIENQEDLSKLVEINNRLDDIVSSLNVQADATDQEKLDAVLVYVLENLEYDKVVSDMFNNGTVDNEKVASFYEGGRLYGALETETSICGNYTALTKALLERMGVENYYLSSSNHAWNLVEVEGNYYYVDSTWLDGKSIQTSTTRKEIDEEGREWEVTSFDAIKAEDAIKNGQADQLEWYMVDPLNYTDQTDREESHDANNLPSFISIKPVTNNASTLETEDENSTITEQEPIKITENDKFEITVGDKKWLVGGAVAIGIMVGLGTAVAANHYKNKKDRERRRRMNEMHNHYGYQSQDFDAFFTDTPTSNSHNSFNSNRRR